MGFIKKKETEPQTDCYSVVQTKRNTHPYNMFSDVSNSDVLQSKLFSTLREAVPVIDSALMKLVRLLGTFQIECDTEEITMQINSFLNSVQTGSLSYGINCFISQYFLTLLTYGTAVGEIVTNGEEVYAIYVSDPEDIRLSQGKNPLKPIVCAIDRNGSFAPVMYPELIFTSVLNPEPGSMYGTSILKGLPFIADTLMKIYNTIGENWERIGNIRYAVTYKPQNDAQDKAYAAKRAKLVAEQWSKTMESGGPVKDFVSVGDVNIRVIGADNQILDSEIPVRQMLEQIIAKLGVPPFLLGFNWSSTERMSSQQSDILTSEIEFYRGILNPVIRKICKTYLTVYGISSDVNIVWNDVTLQDELQQAQTDYYSAQAQNIMREVKESEKNE